jgi:hypothetical protein
MSFAITSLDIIMNYYDITNKISRLVEETHEWSSTILLPDGDKCIDISSAAMGTASVTLANATKQPDVYPKGRAASVYCIDLDIYDENSWMQLKSTLTQVGCVSGCRLVLTWIRENSPLESMLRTLVQSQIVISKQWVFQLSE